jgi:hypothetical protein
LWSHRFLWTGVSSGAVIALLAIAVLWLGSFAIAGDKDPYWTIANIVRFTLPGLIVYPACWYATIFHPRDYSLSRTMLLVGRTFATGCAVVAVTLIAIGVVAMTVRFLVPTIANSIFADGVQGLLRHLTAAAILVAVTPLAYALMTLIGAIILIIPYAIVATPMALLHRWLLLRIFASSGSPTAGSRATAIVSPPPAPFS